MTQSSSSGTPPGRALLPRQPWNVLRPMALSWLPPLPSLWPRPGQSRCHPLRPARRSADLQVHRHLPLGSRWTPLAGQGRRRARGNTAKLNWRSPPQLLSIPAAAAGHALDALLGHRQMPFEPPDLAAGQRRVTPSSVLAPSTASLTPTAVLVPPQPEGPSGGQGLGRPHHPPTPPMPVSSFVAWGQTSLPPASQAAP